MNIGVIIPELGGFSEISIESLKWINIIRKLGYTTHIITGKSKEFTRNLTVMNELHSENNFNLDFSESLQNISKENHKINEFKLYSSRIESILTTWINSNKIDLIIIENYFSVPFNLPVTYALKNIGHKLSCKIIVKHHDAFHKNSVNLISKNSFIKNILYSCFPHRQNLSYHISCNRLIKTYLKENCFINSMIIPYVINGNGNGNGNNCNKILPSETKQLIKKLNLSCTDKILITFCELTPDSNINLIFDLLIKLQTSSFKIIIIAREHKQYINYLDHLKQKISNSNLSSRLIILKDEEILSNKTLSIDQLFAISKGVISFDTGVGFGQPIHLGIEYNCPLLFCTKSKLDWIEMSSTRFKTIQISEKLSNTDVKNINYYINSNVNLSKKNNLNVKNTYSIIELKYIIDTLISTISKKTILEKI